jgi:NADPH-dependent 2,4-dienoyl-CoA reductase/sulfur reductase-like enzyme
VALVSAATLGVPVYLRAQAKPRIVVVGGGAGGATAAHFLARDSAGAIDVTLIDNSDVHTTCFFSNLYLGGYRSFDSITHTYGRLEAEYGITKRTGRAIAIERDANTVVMEDGRRLEYDRLILSPGISFIWDSVPGYSREASKIAPHAWKAGPQTQLLKAKLDALEDGQNIVMVPPPNPYRCPPAPYERVSMMAHVLRSKGYRSSTITILDPKEKFSKQGLFQEGWENHYPGMIEWIGPGIHGGILSVDVEAGAVETDFDTFEGALLNIIPAQRAGGIAQVAGLTDDSGYCPVDADSMRSRMDRNIHVIGDAAIAGAMPKSAFAANSQARVVANHVLGELTGWKIFPAHYSNTCWSLIDADDAVKVGAEYEPRDGAIVSIHSVISQLQEDASLRKANYEEALGWYAGITADMFG